MFTLCLLCCVCVFYLVFYLHLFLLYHSLPVCICICVFHHTHISLLLLAVLLLLHLEFVAVDSLLTGAVQNSLKSISRSAKGWYTAHHMFLTPFQVLRPCVLEFSYRAPGSNGKGLEMEIEVQPMKFELSPVVLNTLFQVLQTISGQKLVCTSAAEFLFINPRLFTSSSTLLEICACLYDSCLQNLPIKSSV